MRRAAALGIAMVAACGARGARSSQVTAVDDATLVIHANQMLDVATGTYVDDVVIAIAGERIRYVGPRDGVRAGAGARVVELGPGVVAMPGLIDAHVHLALGGADPDGAGKTLRAGFTTVRDLGSTGGAGIALRDAIAAGSVVGPRMLVAGAGLGAAGGACDVVFGGEGRIAIVEDAARIVDAQAAAGVDVIKMCTGGGVLPRAADADVVEVDTALATAVVDAASRHGLKVAAHAEGPGAIASAVSAGATSIEHGGLIDAANAAAMRERGTVFVPTLYRIDYTLGQMPAGPQRDAIADGRALAFAQAKVALAAGVTIVLGTDAIVIPHGDNAHELDALVEIGMSPAQAIRAATVDAAAVLGDDVEVGVLAPGKVADVIAVRGDPLAGVAALRDVVFVAKAGVIVRDDR